MTKPLCTGHVEECVNPDCLWRGGNRPDRPCTKCGSQVALRPCRSYPRIGQTKCHAHGGNTPQAEAAAYRRTTETEALVAAGKLAELLDLNDPDDLHPIDGLLEAVRRSVRMARALDTMVRGLDLYPEVGFEIVGDGLHLGGDTGLRWISTNQPLFGPDHQGDGRPHVLIDMLRVWTELAAKACKLALDAGIDERRLQMEEAETDQLLGAVMRALATIEATVPQQEAFTMALAGELRALESA